MLKTHSKVMSIMSETALSLVSRLVPIFSSNDPSLFTGAAEGHLSYSIFPRCGVYLTDVAVLKCICHPYLILAALLRGRNFSRLLDEFF